MLKPTFLLCLSIIIFSCNRGDKHETDNSTDELAELPTEIQRNLKKSESGNFYFYDPPYVINEPIPVPHECAACVCVSESVIFIIARRVICIPFNAPENEGIKAVPFLSEDNSVCVNNEYQFSNQVNQLVERMHCFEHYGPWSATIIRTGDCCAGTITYELLYADNYVKWYNELDDIPDGIQIVGGVSSVDFSAPTCTNCGGSISDCNGNGFGDDNPWDFEDGI